MRLIKPKFEILKPQGLFKDIELAARTCYMSQDKIMQGSDEKIVSNLIERKHGAMLEHGTVYLKMPIALRYSKDINIYKNSNYCKVVEGDKFIEKDIYGEKVRCWYITTNYRFILENNLFQDLKELQCEPTEFHQKRISVKFICDRGISHKLKFVA
jgi:thymidylate synthase (FAD)